MFTPLEILYIVLTFCVLWISAVVFWLLWQVASIMKRANDTVTLVQETLAKMEEAIDGIRRKFDSTGTALGAIMHTTTKAVEYLIDKKMAKKAAAPKKKDSKKKSTTKEK
jgi:DNA anti-recombination protein RmuC